MAEYIDREAVIHAVTHREVNEMLRSDITEQMIDGRNPSAWLAGFECGMQQAIDIIAATPTADVIEIQHGAWMPQIVYGEIVWCCSKCQTIGSPRWNVCPVCVAKMDGKGEGE